jgi:hypothetical protein
VPSAADPGRNLHRSGAAWTLGTVTTILSNPRYTGRQVWNRQRTDKDPADVSLDTRACSGGTCQTAGSSPKSPRTLPWSARPAWGTSEIQRMLIGRTVTGLDVR